MDTLLKHLESRDKKLDPCDLLPLITEWIVDKGSAKQLIDWINGLELEKEEIFKSLNSCSVREEEEVEGYGEEQCPGEKAPKLRQFLPAQPDGHEEAVTVPIS